MNNIEKNIYELLGIKQFKKLTFKFVYLLFKLIDSKMTKTDIQKLLCGTNYKLNSGNRVQALKNFKKKLSYNTIIHFVGLLLFLVNICLYNNIINVIICLIFMLLNSYCIMLQRYNTIRINSLLKKIELSQNKIELPDKKINKNSKLAELKSYKRILNNINTNSKEIEFELKKEKKLILK